MCHEAQGGYLEGEGEKHHKVITDYTIILFYFGSPWRTLL